jgi:hypothetical protein
MGRGQAAVSAIGGALTGLAHGLRENERTRVAREGIDAREEIARLQSEVRILLESMRDARYDRPSGNTTAQQEGQDRRTAATNQTREDVAVINQTGATDRAIIGQEGQNYRWNRPSGNTLHTRSSVERVADANNAARQTIQQFLEQGRQNRFTIGEQGRNTRFNLSQETVRQGQRTAAQTAAENRQSRERIEADRNNRMGAVNFLENPQAGEPPPAEPNATQDVRTGAPRPQVPPQTEIVNDPVDPDTPASPEAADDKLTQLASKVAAATKRYRDATTPAAQEAARQELLRLRKEVEKATGGVKPAGGI